MSVRGTFFPAGIHFWEQAWYYMYTRHAPDTALGECGGNGEGVMEKLMRILVECCPGVDFAGCERLVDDGVITSLNIVMIVGEINEEFGVSITVTDLIPENFNSAGAIYGLIRRLGGA